MTQTTATAITAGFWEDIQPIYAEILAQPFINELADGSLSRERFAFYMKQDALYLRDFARALALTGSRAPDVEQLQVLVGFSHGVAMVERALHESYLEEFGTTIDVDQSPACLAYTQFLLAEATTAPYREAVAALLPCFWIYREVGLEIVERSAATLDTNPYAHWIATYSGDDFNASADRAIALTEEAARTASAEELALMRHAFDRSSRLEWMFWDSAYRLEQWPPAQRKSPLEHSHVSR
jgi:thiaminase/transcriptional activator TenA